jgi:hypothetical protein
MNGPNDEWAKWWMGQMMNKLNYEQAKLWIGKMMNWPNDEWAKWKLADLYAVKKLGLMSLVQSDNWGKW